MFKHGYLSCFVLNGLSQGADGIKDIGKLVEWCFINCFYRKTSGGSHLGAHVSRSTW